METEQRQLSDHLQHQIPSTVMLNCSNADMEDMFDMLLQDAEYCTAALISTLSTTVNDNDANFASKTHNINHNKALISQQYDSNIISYNGNSDDGDIDYIEHAIKIRTTEDNSILCNYASDIIKDSNSNHPILQCNMDSSAISTTENADQNKPLHYNKNAVINPIIAINQKATITTTTRQCVGPTLMDIESALASISAPASSSSSTTNSSSNSSASSSTPLSTNSASINIIDPAQQIKMSTSSIWQSMLNNNPVTSLGNHNGGLISSFNNIMEDEDDDLCTWKKIHKRNQMEPRYSLKMKCEEAAACDGYRWRKYGQKAIKNSPYPRSYYRCSIGKCRVKKQVERCNGDAKMVLVTYEGIHLHKQ